MSPKRILVIDDGIIMLELLQVCLSKLGGWQILTASTASAGLWIAKEEHPDAIIIDVRRPGSNGSAFLAKMRQITSLQSIPMVILSEGAHWLHPEDSHHCFTLGWVDLFLAEGANPPLFYRLS